MLLIAHNAHCPACLAIAEDELGPQAGEVTGQLYSFRQSWVCVYCGGPVTVNLRFRSVLWRSLTLWATVLWWELYTVGDISKYPVVSRFWRGVARARRWVGRRG